MRYAIVALTIVCGALTASGQELETNCSLSKCEGGDAAPHNEDTYSFTTYTQVREEAGASFFETCVENTSNKDLDFRWIIPGPNSWVPRGCALKNVRAMQSSKKLDTYASCVIYGNSGKYLRAPFIPHESDKKFIDGEPRDCRLKSADYGPAIQSDTLDAAVGEDAPLRLELASEVFAPYVASDIERTLTKINFKSVLELHKEKGEFTTHVEYFLSPAFKNQKEYYITDFYAVMPQESEVFYASTDHKAGEPVFLDPKGGKFSFGGKLPSNPILTSVQHKLISKEGAEVASFWVPMFEAK